MENQASTDIAAALAHRVGVDADAARIAYVMTMAWQEIDAVLSPILGRGGVAALYKRSLYLTGLAHPWLSNLHRGEQTDMGLAELESVFGQQSSADAAGAGGALLQTFNGLLASMVGPALTEQLLRPVWNHLLSGPSAQDEPQ
ncbi:MAG: hypothetical protein ABIS85_07545 [Pseudoxanthomonas sp.]